MTASIYRFEFDRLARLEEAELTLHLAMVAAEGLFGRARVRMEARYRRDRRGLALLVNASSEVGRAIARMFTGLLLREFGEDALRVCAVRPETTA